MVWQVIRGWFGGIFRAGVRGRRPEAEWADVFAASTRAAALVAENRLELARVTDSHRRKLAQLRASSASRHAVRPVAQTRVLDDSAFASFGMPAVNDGPDAACGEDYPRTMIVPRETPRKPSRD